MDHTLVDFDPRLQGPFSMIIGGPSGCGKTELISKLIFNVDSLITPLVDKIIFHYGVWQTGFTKLQGKVIFKEGLPTEDDLIPKASDKMEHVLCIIDDLMSENDKKFVADLFTKGSHHWMISVVYITQNIYEKASKYYRTMSLNTDYLIAFKNPRDMSQIRYLSQQAFPHNPKLLTEIYNMETKQPHSYLLVDFKQSTPDRFRVRSSITSPDNQLIFN